MNKKFKIGYFADGIWAHEAFKLLQADDSISIEFICGRYSTEDVVLKELSQQFGIDYLRYPNINDQQVVVVLQKYGCDLFISLSFNQIFKKEVFNLPRFKTINCHAGKLPFYRGRNVLNWVLINDEKEFGITIHYVDEGIDTGDIILQHVYPIDDNDNYRTLLNKAYSECAKLIYQAVKIIEKGKITVIKQVSIHPTGFYCGMRQIGDELINWEQSSRDIFNFVRAICRPGPMARTFLNGKLLSINKCEIITYAPVYKGIVGQVVGVIHDGFVAKTNDATIGITEFEFDGKIKIGDRLG